MTAVVDTVVGRHSSSNMTLSRCCSLIFFFLMIRRPPRSTLSSSSAASDVYKRQIKGLIGQNKTEYEPFVVYYDPIEVNVNDPEDFEGNVFVRFMHPSLLQIVFWVIIIFGILFLLLMIAKMINKRGGEEKQRLVKGERSHLVKVLDSEGQGPTESFQSNQDAYQEDLQNEEKVKSKITEKYSQFYQPETLIE
eukprot:TRINITY_DN3142_c0_g1_i11.p2 TRINITY_DN3142_c0_g1~~TRINITY_DN3142_c0_g1_i11.p2  ORF type:complete len:193 (-),score=30.19 TRINITY_DN3142_c0_g1_i11:288-866(-)